MDWLDFKEKFQFEGEVIARKRFRKLWWKNNLPYRYKLETESMHVKVSKWLRKNNQTSFSDALS